MIKTLRNLAIGANIALMSAGCENKNEVKTGIIERESFYPSKSFNTYDRYNALVKTLDGESIDLSYLDSEARRIDLRYNVGDTVNVRLGLGGMRWSYEIVPAK